MNFLHFLLARFTLGNMVLFRRGLVPGSLVPDVWVLLAEYSPWILWEMLLSFGAQCLARQ